MTLLVLADQKRVQGTRPGIRKECAFPTVLLVDYEVELIEVVSGYKCFFAGLFRKDSVEFCGDDELLPRPKPVEQRKLSMYVRSETRVHPTTRMPGNGVPTITLMWEKRQANAGKIPRAKEIGIIARSAFILHSLIFFTNAWVFLNGMYAGRLVESAVVGTASVVISKENWWLPSRLKTAKTGNSAPVTSSR